jgi:hypothetical protein
MQANKASADANKPDIWTDLRHSIDAMLDDFIEKAFRNHVDQSWLQSGNFMRKCNVDELRHVA